MGANSLLIIPNATSVVVHIFEKLDDEKLLVYRQ